VCQLLLSSRYRWEGEERTKIDSIYFAVDDDGCTLATKDVDRLINFNVVESYGLGLLEFLRTPWHRLMIKYRNETERKLTISHLLPSNKNLGGFLPARACGFEGLVGFLLTERKCQC
jgi:hypothetical protein